MNIAKDYEDVKFIALHDLNLSGYCSQVTIKKSGMCDIN